VVELLNYLKNAIAALSVFIHNKAKLRRVFEDHSVSYDPRETFAFLLQHGDGPFALVIRTDKSDVNRRGVQIAGNGDLVDGYNTDFANGQFAANRFSNLSFEKLLNALKSE